MSHEYTIQVVASAFLAGKVTIKFYTKGTHYQTNPLAQFNGHCGGLAVGTGVSWGTAWLNYDIADLTKKGWKIRFEANFAVAAINVNLWGPQGEKIGHTASGGIAAILGVVGGEGVMCFFEDQPLPLHEAIIE
mmetsp:Transcript_6507/g.11226  ORF Transcript_6507/g.11226 Transcript_6507/m.11226 type:complete len:133 (-) Transcript_6507:458-856(-)